LGKFLLIVVVGIAVYFIVRAYARSLGAKPPGQSEGAGAGEDMVRCAHCGVLLPSSESVESDGARFCSEEHRRVATR